MLGGALLADRKKQVTDADFVSLVSSQLHQADAVYALEGLQITCGTMGMPTATVRLVGPEGSARVEAALGSGPVDACFKAIDAIVGIAPCLLEYTVSSVTEGIDALGEVSVRSRASGREAMR